MNPALYLLMPLALGQPIGPLASLPTGSSLASSASCAPCAPGYGGPSRGMVPPYMPVPARQPCPPMGPPAPVLAVRTVIPEGTTITAMPGSPGAKAHGNAVTFGFRPGYAYRLKLDQLPDFPNEALYPVLEVRGSIVPRPGMKYMEYAAPLNITKEDIQRALAGALITKVIYLEDPARAIPSSGTPERPIEIRSDDEREAFQEASENGRIVAVLRLGDRKPEADELKRMAVEGTVLMPGENQLGFPSGPPMLPTSGIPLYDPILGPKATTEECFPNGGDGENRIGIGPGGRLGGLNPTDVSAEYTSNGKRKVTTSNVICICSPRFVMRRVELMPGGFFSKTVVSGVNQTTKQNIFMQKERSLASIAREKTLGFNSRSRPSATISMWALHAIASKTIPQAVFRVDGLRSVGTFVEPDELSSLPEGLILTKEVTPAGPVQQGEELLITLRYTNTGRKPITDLILSDSLSARLEYVPGSAQADRPSNVTTIANEVDSVVVQFEIPGPIPPSSKGIVQFKVRVR